MTEYEPPNGYEIHTYHNPAEIIVYGQTQTCKCCGHNDNMMQSLKRFNGDSPEVLTEARNWLDNYVKEQNNGTN